MKQQRSSDKPGNSGYMRVCIDCDGDMMLPLGKVIHRLEDVDWRTALREAGNPCCFPFSVTFEFSANEDILTIQCIPSQGTKSTWTYDKKASEWDAAVWLGAISELTLLAMAQVEKARASQSTPKT